MSEDHLRSGRRRDTVVFQSPVESRDRDGKLVQGWEDQFTVSAHVKPLRGSEAVMQARVSARAPAILSVRLSAQTLRIMADWRAVVEGRIFDLKELPRRTNRPRFLEMLVEAGG
ncbi:head-tail adaptor protein [Paracoccus aminophilus]|uniref:head-tail adaptor protein n=1 Tax=Paracoccus aminophilus TaxID=34003 RepID=UPI00059F94C5|nr:head-tail adaptor protein [Paracoccus aminophilus]